MSKRLTRRVLLIGWAAADWKIINPLIDAGKMPVLARLLDYGVSGKISTLQPVLSPILWSSIATGKRADKHGILGFAEPIPGGHAIRPVQSTSRRAKALWNILSQQSLRSSVVNWPASHPAEMIAGTVFSDRFTDDALGPDGDLIPLPDDAVHSPELLQVAEDLRIHPSEITPEQLSAFFDPGHAPEPHDPRLASLARILAQCATTHNAATWLAARDDWDLLAVYYDAIERVGRGFIEYHPPAMAHVSPEDAAIYGEIVNNMYRFHDIMLGTLLDLAGPEASVILLSDHGFYSDHLRPAILERFRQPEKKRNAEMNPVSWHRPHGIFVAAGQSLKHDELIHGATLLDIAPTVLTLLGQPLPDDMDGLPLTPIFEEPSHPPNRIASFEPPHPNDGVRRDRPAGENDPAAARQALQQFADLGYLDLAPGGESADLAARNSRDQRNHLAQVYFSAGRATEAIRLLRGLLAENDDADLRCHLGLCLVSLGRAEEAEEVIARVPAGAAQSPLPQLILGQVRLAQGRFDEAVALLEPLGQEDFPLSYLHNALGEIYAQRGMLAEAETAFHRALERADDNA